MSSLSVPKLRTNSNLKKAGSSASLRSNPAVELADNDLAHVTRSSRRNSDSSINAPTLTRPPTQPLHTTTNTTLYAGCKPFIFATKALQKKLPYFTKLLAETPEPLPEQVTFDDADEASMALLQQWVSRGDNALGGPRDFHTIGHYLGLYVLGRRFGSEALQNRVMDLLRAHYAAQNLTAPPYRLEYIHTFAPNSPMQGFLLATAAQRCKYTKDQPAVSDSLFGVLQPRTELMRGFLEYVIHAEDVDVRYGDDCV